MTEQTFERRVHAWLEAGPTELPDDAIGHLRVAIDDVAQERPPIRLFRGSMSVPAMRAAVVLAVAVALAGGAIWLRTTRPDVATPNGDLLSEFPTATLILERSGEPAEREQTIALGGLSAGESYVIAASCTGGDGMIARVYYPPDYLAVPAMTAGPDPSPAPTPRPILTSLAVDCDGVARHLNVGTQDLPEQTTTDVELTVEPGVAWRIAIGAYRQSAAQPEFAPLRPTDGWHVVGDMPPNFVTSELALGIPTTGRDRLAAVLVQCLGDPVTLTVPGTDVSEDVACTDAEATTRVEVPATEPQVEARIVTDGATWVRLGGEVDGDIVSSLPSAPPLPDGLADVGFVDTDGQYVAFGHLGSNRQSVVWMPDAFPGVAGGDFVGLWVPEGDARRLELWSISSATKVADLAAWGNSSLGPSWVDERHGHVFYVIYLPDFSAEWHRVALDGSDDRVIATSPADYVTAEGILSVDDATFVIDWCPAEGACTRVLHDTATGTNRTIQLDGDRTCFLRGVVEATVVAESGPTCDERDGVHLTAQSVEGGPRTVLADGDAAPGDFTGAWASAAVVSTSAGDRVVSSVAADDGSTTTFWVVDMSGATTVAPVVIPDGDYELSFAKTAGATGDWVVIGGLLGDTPQNQLSGGPLPRLLNVVTGEVIELPNLPHRQ